MKNLALAVGALLGLISSSADAWNNHTLATYRAMESMPEVANAVPVVAEPLDTFLREEERTIEALLASQEAWALANLQSYPPRPLRLAFTANPDRSDDARRLAFSQALRIAPDSRFALFIQPDPKNASSAASRLSWDAVSTVPLPSSAGQKFHALKPGDSVAPLTVLATAADEPDYGLDMHLFEDNPSEWGKLYGFGLQPFGNPTPPYNSQAPFHMDFPHESRPLYAAMPSIKRTFPQLRVYQFSSLAALAFRTGHPYWGWRFAGLALHYVQDLTHPYHATPAPGESALTLVTANTLALVGLPAMQSNIGALTSNRRMALNKYQTELLQNAAASKQDSPVEHALRTPDKDSNYPEWYDLYLRNVVSSQAASYGARMTPTLLASMPEAMVSDPSFDFNANEEKTTLLKEVRNAPAPGKARLDALVLELLTNFGAHSRNAVRGILKASNR